MANSHTNIKDFVHHVKKNGVATNNRFDILFTPPDMLLKKISFDPVLKASFGDGRGMAIMALSVVSPGVNLSTTETRLGIIRKIAYDKSTGELDVVFRCSKNMAEKRLFDMWIDMIINGKRVLEYYENYITDMTVSAVDNNNNSTYTTGYNEVYPMLLTPLTFDRDTQNQVQTFQVTFAYRKVYNNDIDQYQPNPSPLSASNAKFGSADPRIVPRPTLPFINAIPGLTQGQSQQVVDMYKTISRITEEIQRGGLDAASGAKLIASTTRSVRASLGDGMPGDAVNVALEYLNDASFLLKR